MKDKIVVITGAGSGIGRALAEEFGILGAKLVLNDYAKEDLYKTVSILENKGIQVSLVKDFDVSDRTSMDSFADQVKKEIGLADIVINNAGISGVDLPGYLIKEEDYRRVMEVNFFGVLHGCRAFLPQMVEKNSGAMVNISSVFGLVGMPNNSDYCASKFAVRGFTESLAVEFYDSPITIHCVHPGGINTRIGRNNPNQELVKKLLRTNPNDMAKSIISGIQKKKAKIVYGSDSSRLWFASNFIPQNWANKLIWKEAKRILDPNHYKTFLKSL